MKDNCKGCKTNFDETEGPCSLVKHSHKCPCVKCLIKPMCENACKEYSEFYEIYDKDRQELRRQAYEKATKAYADKVMKGEQ